MSESGDYNPGVWSGHDFASARKSYRSHAAASYTTAIDRGITAKDLVPEKLSTKSSNPLVIITDQTGSMGEWPATIFSKLPYLEHEAKTEYLGEDVEISWGAIGDATNGEQYPLQIRPFAKGTDLAEKLKELVIEGKGGGTTQESYELAALYCARNIDIPNAVRPILVFIGDESPYDHIDPSYAKEFAHVNLAQKLRTLHVFEELKRSFAVYFIQKPYNEEKFVDGPLKGTSKRVHEDWENLVGEDHIALLGDPGRVVDVLFGILAKEAGKIPYFQEEIEGRQEPDQIKRVYDALRGIHALPNTKNFGLLPAPGRSVTRRSKEDEGDESEPLV